MIRVIFERRIDAFHVTQAMQYFDSIKKEYKKSITFQDGKNLKNIKKKDIISIERV